MFKGKDTIVVTVREEPDGNKHLYFQAETRADKHTEHAVAEASDAT